MSSQQGFGVWWMLLACLVGPAQLAAQSEEFQLIQHPLEKLMRSREPQENVPMTRRRRVFRGVLIGCLGLLLLPCGFFGLWLAAASGSDRGSPALAAEWRDHLAQFPDPDAAQTADPSVIVVRCENGDWVFGRAQSSHGVWLRGGGTVVMRDSGGRIRAFFGHVCGGSNLPGSFGRLPDLATFYAAVVTDGFVEHPLE